MKISTIIPAYNRADLIAETLDAVLSQTLGPAEVIVVDDGSSDGTSDIVAGYGKAVKLVRQANAGAGAARNRGLTLASGDLVNFLDSDDVPSLDTYKVQSRAITDGDADMAYGPWLKVRFGDGVLTPEPVVLQQRPISGRLGMDDLILRGKWVTVFQPCMFRRSVIDAAGPYREDLKPSEDTEMLYRIAREMRRAVHTPESILLYRVHPENQVSAQDPAKRLVDWSNLWVTLTEHARDRPDLGPRTALWADDMLARARRDLAKAWFGGQIAKGEEAPPLHLSIRAARFASRVATKIRRTMHGNCYTSEFGAGKVTRAQIEQIAKLGYKLDTAAHI